MNHYDAVIFDLDGTLLDTLTDLAASANQALRKLGFPEHPVTVYRYFVGDGIRNLMRRCLPADYHHDDALVESAVQAMTAAYQQQWGCRTRAYHGIPELIQRLRTASVPQAVLSNKPHRFTCRMTDHFFPEKPFAVVQGESETIPRKPDPAGALALAVRLAAAPERILYLGDTDTDMQTAVAAGMCPVGACWGFRSREELKQNGARYLASHPSDLTTLLWGKRPD